MENTSKIILKKKYAIGVHVMFYEVSLFHTYIDGLINLLSTVENTENVMLDFCFNVSEFLEKIDKVNTNKSKLTYVFSLEIERLNKALPGFNIVTSLVNEDEDYISQSHYRREFNSKYCMLVDYVMWGETDSFFPREAFQALETLSDYTDSQNIHRYLACFADRKMWDDSWNPTVHPYYENIPFIDDDNASNNLNYAKSALPLEKMNEINSKIEGFEITSIKHPKIDGSCLVFTSDLIKCGVNVPQCFIHNDDESISVLSKAIMGDQFVQFIFKNLLKVHARRHPQKRLYIANENNPKGFCGSEKGDKWLKFRQLTEFNVKRIINSQEKFKTPSDL